RRHPPAGSRERLRPSRLRSRDSHRERPLRRRPGRTEHHRTRRRDPGHDRGRRGRLMGVTVGPVGDDRAAEYLAAMGQAFGFDSSDEHRERFSKYFEWDRARAAYDGDRIVGTLGAFSLDLTVPGGTLPCGGTTVVSVLPTHRRRGILRQLMDAHFEDVRARDEPLAGLWASKSSIYGRFGYGLAAVGLDVEVSRAHVDFHRLAAMPAPSRLVS